MLPKLNFAFRYSTKSIQLQEYGKTPRYIKRNRHLIEKMKKIEQDANKVPEPSMRYVEDEEKDAVLNVSKR